VRSPWARAAGLAVALAIVWFAGRSLARNWEQLRTQPLDWRLQPGWVLLSCLVVWSMYAILIVAWRRMLGAWGQPLDGWTAARIWTVSSLGKYVPGKVWAVAGMALMSKDAGIAPWAATGSAVILQALAVGTGAAVAACTGAGALESARPGIRVALLALVAASVTGIVLLLWPPVLRRLLSLAGSDLTGGTAPAAGGIAFGIASNFVAWVGYGVALWLLARGILPDSGLTLLLAIAAFAASYLAGFLALLVPGGFGVREGLLILMLQGPMGIGAATVLALASRLLLTVTEVGAAAPFLAYPRGRARVAR
jgi:glycosyltransferase 2 family protein